MQAILNYSSLRDLLDRFTFRTGMRYAARTMWKSPIVCLQQALDYCMVALVRRGTANIRQWCPKIIVDVGAAECGRSTNILQEAHL
jgi:hypothetical protein